MFSFFSGQVVAMGFGRDADIQGMTYGTIFPYLEQQEDPASVSYWITPLVLYLITRRGDLDSLMRFVESVQDTPLHAATRFCALTGTLHVVYELGLNDHHLFDCEVWIVFHGIFPCFINILKLILWLTVGIRRYV